MSNPASGYKEGEGEEGKKESSGGGRPTRTADDSNLQSTTISGPLPHLDLSMTAAAAAHKPPYIMLPPPPSYMYHHQTAAQSSKGSGARQSSPVAHLHSSINTHSLITEPSSSLPHHISASSAASSGTLTPESQRPSSSIIHSANFKSSSSSSSPGRPESIPHHLKLPHPLPPSSSSPPSPTSNSPTAGSSLSVSGFPPHPLPAPSGSSTGPPPSSFTTSALSDFRPRSLRQKTIKDSRYYRPIPAAKAAPHIAYMESTWDDWTFELRLIQACSRARINGIGSRDRRTLDPPPIIQLMARHKVDQNVVAVRHHAFPFLVCRAVLRAEDGRALDPDLVEQMFIGSLISSSVYCPLPDGTEGVFFLFGDLSVCIDGTFTLEFSLFDVSDAMGAVIFPPPPPATENVTLDPRYDPAYPTPGTTLMDPSKENTMLSSILSPPFIVYPTKKFPGMLKSTELTYHFWRQGVKLPVRKEERKRRSSGISASFGGGVGGGLDYDSAEDDELDYLPSYPYMYEQQRHNPHGGEDDSAGVGGGSHAGPSVGLG